MSALVSAATAFTPEQLDAIERREGDLFLDAAAGSGKTSVLVERFVRAVLEDGIDVAAILTITFTDKAAAEMRDRIRAALRERGALEAARATEGAFISTIHGFCARLLRAHALAAGIDPAFTVLDELEAGRLADAAFADALEELAGDAAGVELIAAYGNAGLRAAIQSIHGELRARGELRPRLPAAPLPADDLAEARRRLEHAAAGAARELGAIAAPSAKVLQAIERLERVQAAIAAAAPWPGELDALRLPGGNGAALSSPACEAYSQALEALRSAGEVLWAGRVLAPLGRLLGSFGERYERLKRESSGLDFEDLELLCLELLRSDRELCERYRERFERVMVDELQDTNAVQLHLIDAVARGNLFTVGDAQQSIYAFRHADVGLFERRGEELARAGARASLRTNFRSRAEILEVLARAFAGEPGDAFVPLAPGRTEAPADEPRVELLVADQGVEWAPEGVAAPWRLAEAGALADRVAELVSDGAAPGEIAVLIRATTDMRVYERALEQRGVPTYVIGGRGYWSHPQVVDLVSYLRVLANPRDEEALYTLLASPMVGASADALVLLGAAARDAGRDPWRVLREMEGRIAELSSEDQVRISEAAAWLAAERLLAPRKGVEELIERALDQTGYDLEVLAMPGGQRRLANVRKLMRLGREHQLARGPDLHGFLELVRARSQWWRADSHDSEAPVASEALDAVRVMTIHRAKGLEFEIVCVADLGRGPRWSGELIRVGRDGRLGVRLARPGTGAQVPALDYEELGAERRAAATREERRLYYVALTRARERLIVSGAARIEAWGAAGGGAAPMAWLGPALVPELGSAGEGIHEGVRFRVVRPCEPGDAPVADVDDRVHHMRALDRPGPVEVPPATPPEPEPVRASTTLSYSSLAAYRRCGYRYYVERVLGVPPTHEGASTGEPGGGLTAAERGTAVHALLERLDFRHPATPTTEAILAASPRAPSAEEVGEIGGLVARFAAGSVCNRLARATRVQREQRFAFLLGDALIIGVLDVIASEQPDAGAVRRGEAGCRAGRKPARTLVVDYKTDRLQGLDPAAIVASEYATQRLIYALAALRSGAPEVEVAYAFLEAPDDLVTETFDSDRAGQLERQLSALAEGLLESRFTVADTPHRALCAGCPAAGGLCSWPLELTQREAPDRLF